MNPTFNELVNLMSEFHRMEMYKEEEKIKRIVNDF